jgi:excisionase family DNA binding protein
MDRLAMPKGQDGLASIPEVQAFLKVSRSTVYTIMNRGELPFVKFGKCRRIPWSALREYVDKHTVHAAA